MDIIIYSSMPDSLYINNIGRHTTLAGKVSTTLQINFYF